MKVYAAEHGMELSEVTPAMVKGSQEGLLFWASKGLDCSARGAAGQALNRALEKNPTVKHDIYKWLGEDLKRKFRLSWSVERSFEKVCKQRTRTLRNLGSLVSYVTCGLFVIILGSSSTCDEDASLGTPLANRNLAAGNQTSS